MTNMSYFYSLTHKFLNKLMQGLLLTNYLTSIYLQFAMFFVIISKNTNISKKIKHTIHNACKKYIEIKYLIFHITQLKNHMRNILYTSDYSGKVLFSTCLDYTHMQINKHCNS